VKGDHLGSLRAIRLAWEDAEDLAA